MFAVSGLASGLDTNSMIEQLVELERRPILQLQNREANFQVELSTYGTLQGLLTDLKTSVESLKLSSDFNTQTATSGDPELFTATANAESTPSTFGVTVQQLAQSQRLRSEAFATNTEVVGQGTLHLRVGSGSVADIEIGEAATIQDVATAINESSVDVNATVIYDGTQHFLTLSTSTTGAENLINLTVTDSDGGSTDTSGLSRLVYDAGVTENLTETQAPLDALISIDGLTDIARSSNTISDVIQGVTLDLLKAPESPDNTATVSITHGTEDLSGKLQGFFDAYNALQDFFAKEQLYDATTGTAGTLLGDSTANLIRRRLDNLPTTQLDGFASNLNALSDLGIGIDSSEHLTFTSETRLDEALSEDVNAVINFFTQNNAEGKGFANHLEDIIDGFLNSENGALTAKTNGLTKRVQRINEDIENIEQSVARTARQLEDQFLSLELIISELSNTQTFLTQQLAGIQNVSAGIARGR